MRCEQNYLTRKELLDLSSWRVLSCRFHPPWQAIMKKSSTSFTLYLLLALLPYSSASIAAEPVTEPTVAELKAEIDRLNSIVPGQAFAMTQVAYNFSNLWFAAQAGNWPLAKFYIDETRVRLRWAMRVQPVRRISTGQLELGPIATAIENTQIAAVADAVANQDLAAFRPAYTGLMQSCQGCHEASEKPYLRLQIPAQPAEPLMVFTP